MSPSKILVPVDFSEQSECALSVATSIAQERAGSLLIVYVDLSSRIAEGRLNKSLPPFDRSVYWDALKRVVSPTTGVPYEHHMLRGHAADANIQFAKEHSVELIVIGTRPRSGIFSWLKSSIAETIVRNAPCPVLTVKQSGSFPNSSSSPAPFALS